MKANQACSWCHTENDVSQAAQLLPVHCSRCGHRADVPRLACDCAECLMRKEIIGDDLPQAFAARA